MAQHNTNVISAFLAADDNEFLEAKSSDLFEELEEEEDDWDDDDDDDD